MGAVEERIIDQAIQAGEDLPEKIKNAPELLRGLVLYYNAFQDLSSCRNLGMSLGPIPWDAINGYCLTYDITGEQREDMFYFVNVMDSVYRAHVDKGTKTPDKGGGKTRTKGRK